MNKEQRIPYRVLTKIALPLPDWSNVSLCLFCKYASWIGSCKEAELECEHPIDIIGENSHDTWAGGDCWGFKPKYTREDCVDIVGILLQGQRMDWDSVPLIGKNKSQPLPGGVYAD